MPIVTAYLGSPALLPAGRLSCGRRQAPAVPSLAVQTALHSALFQNRPTATVYRDCCEAAVTLVEKLTSKRRRRAPGPLVSKPAAGPRATLKPAGQGILRRAASREPVSRFETAESGRATISTKAQEGARPGNHAAQGRRRGGVNARPRQGTPSERPVQPDRGNRKLAGTEQKPRPEGEEKWSSKRSNAASAAASSTRSTPRPSSGPHALAAAHGHTLSTRRSAVPSTLPKAGQPPDRLTPRSVGGGVRASVVSNERGRT